jgi:hypothetical protein
MADTRPTIDYKKPVTYTVGDSMSRTLGAAILLTNPQSELWGIDSTGLLQGDGRNLANNSRALLGNIAKLAGKVEPKDTVYYHLGHNDWVMGRMIASGKNQTEIAKYETTLRETMHQLGAQRNDGPKLIFVAPLPFLKDQRDKHGRLVATMADSNSYLDRLKNMYERVAKELGVTYIDPAKLDRKLAFDASLRSADGLHWRDGADGASRLATLIQKNTPSDTTVAVVVAGAKSGQTGAAASIATVSEMDLPKKVKTISYAPPPTGP